MKKVYEFESEKGGVFGRLWMKEREREMMWLYCNLKIKEITKEKEKNTESLKLTLGGKLANKGHSYFPSAHGTSVKEILKWTKSACSLESDMIE